MIAEFSNMQTLMWVGVALLAHVVIIGATSVTYLRDQIDPAGAVARKTAQANAAAAAAAAATQPASAPAVADAAPAPANPDASPAATPAAAEVSDDKAMEDRKDSAMVKKITEAAKPAEIPAKPNNTGIDLDETLTPGK